MIQRSAFGILLISVLFGMVAADASIARWMPFDSRLLSRGSFLPPLMVLVTIATCRELAQMSRRMGIAPYEGWATLCSVCLVLAPWLSAGGVLGEGTLALEPYHLEVTVLGGGLVTIGLVGVLRQDVSGGLPAVAGSWFIVGYAGLLLSFLSMLRCDAHIPGHLGAWVVLMVVLVCKSSDIAAYYLGSWFGRHRLCPELSPGKSIEGLGGAVLGGIAVSLLFLVLNRVLSEGENTAVADPEEGWRVAALLLDATFLFNRMSAAQALVFGALMAIFGHCGDLFASLLKRSAGVKDSGNLIPGFGGMVDMIDSPLVAAPVAWFLLTRVWHVL
jgi:phosphatidate cytidylyltransferase